MDYLSYIEDANSAINMDDYTIYNAIDAIQGIQQADYDTLTQKMVGSQLNQSAREQAAEAKSLGEAIQNGDYAAGATSAGTLILGREKAFELAAKTRDAIFGKSEAAEEGGEETTADAATETTTTTVDAGTEAGTATADAATATSVARPPTDMSIFDDPEEEAAGEEAAGEGITAEDLVAAGLDPEGTSAALSAAAARGAGEGAADFSTVTMTGAEADSDLPALADAPTVAATEGTTAAADTSAAITADNLMTLGSTAQVPATESVLADAGADVGSNLQMGSRAATGLESESGAVDVAEGTVGGMAAPTTTDLTSLGYGTAIESGPAAGTSVGVEMSGTAAQNTAQGFSSISGTTEAAGTEAAGSTAVSTAPGVAGVGVDTSRLATIDTVGVEGGEAGAGAAGGAAASEGAAAGGEVAGETAATVGTEAGVEAGAGALEAAGLALQAIPFADIIGAGLLIGGASIAPIMDAVDKKKEKKEKRKAKKKAKEQEQAAQTTYNQAVSDHNQAIQSLNSNHHSAITGGIVQQTATAVGSASF